MQEKTSLCRLFPYSVQKITFFNEDDCLLHKILIEQKKKLNKKCVKI